MVTEPCDEEVIGTPLNPSQELTLEETAFLSLVFIGVCALVGGMVRARINWRADVPPYGRDTSLLDLTLNPGPYVRERAVRGIRTLNVAGFLALFGAICILVHKAVSDVSTAITR